MSKLVNLFMAHVMMNLRKSSKEKKLKSLDQNYQSNNVEMYWIEKTKCMPKIQNTGKNKSSKMLRGEKKGTRPD